MNNNNKHLLFNIIYYKYSVLSGKAISNKTSYDFGLCVVWVFSQRNLFFQPDLF